MPAYNFFLKVQQSVKFDVMDYLPISPANRSAAQRRLPDVLERDGLADTSHVFWLSLIYTTHIKKLIARIYFFILRNKITEK